MFFFVFRKIRISGTYFANINIAKKRPDTFIQIPSGISDEHEEALLNKPIYLFAEELIFNY